jgi:hypothetical protein
LSRLALNHDLSDLHFPCTWITSMHHHAQLMVYFASSKLSPCFHVNTAQYWKGWAVGSTPITSFLHDEQAVHLVCTAILSPRLTSTWPGLQTSECKFDITISFPFLFVLLSKRNDNGTNKWVKWVTMRKQ